jgi:hypothetical protein
MENRNNEIAKVKLAIKNKLPTEHNFGLETYLEYLMEMKK